MAKKRRKRRYTGRFLPCQANLFAHADLIACEVLQAESEHYYTLCPTCMTRSFLNTWEDGWGYTLAEVEAMGARAPSVPPQRRLELLGQAAQKPVRRTPPLSPVLRRPPAGPTTRSPIK